LGIGLSLPVGGWLSESWNNAFLPGTAPLGLVGWQAAFIGVGLPGILLAMWVLSLREPPRMSASGQRRPAVRSGTWRLFLLDLMSILPPFTLFALGRFEGGFARNVR